MRHKTRTALRLLALGVLVVGVWQVVPRALEQLDLHFGKSAYQADTEKKAASLPIQYVDTELCFQCHEGKHDEWMDAKHRTISCETCHGPGKAHVEENQLPLMDTSREACGMCHGALDARPDDFPQIDLSQHNPSTACVACHNPMGAALQIPHPVTEHGNCLSCHGNQGFRPLPVSHDGRTGGACQVCHWPGNLDAFPADHAGRTDDMCQMCHQASLVLPPKVTHNLEGMERCTACHSAGAIAALPESHLGRNQETCLLCHKEFMEPTPIPHAVSNRGTCSNCHGSGVPMGSVLPSHEGRTDQTCLVCHKGR